MREGETEFMLKQVVAIIGAGPAGLFAAQVLSQKPGVEVHVFDAKPSAGRKFLVAGKSGLNLTNAVDAERFLAKYKSSEGLPDYWSGVLQGFDASALRAWAEDLGQSTFVSSGKKVFPECMKAAPLLRSWLQRLRSQGVLFHYKHSLVDISSTEEKGVKLRFHATNEEGSETVTFDVNKAVLSLGGGSWKSTGSDGVWQALLKSKGVEIEPLVAANCGWRCAWNDALLPKIEGLPIKNVEVKAGDMALVGELILTKYGIEGGPIYQLGVELRKMPKPRLTLDFKPSLSVETVQRKLESVRSQPVKEMKQRLKLDDASLALIASQMSSEQQEKLRPEDLAFVVDLVKNFSLPVIEPQPLDEAISSAGGVCFESITEDLMLRACPQVYVAGEMLNWEAPTGGFLLQGCFATAHHVAKRILT